jgi:hypothetical protein
MQMTHDNDCEWRIGFDCTCAPKPAALDAAEARAVVKPLVWDDWDNADTVVGLYRVRAAGRVWAWTLDDDDVYLHGAVAANKVDAQAAAQADYETRILSAITITAPSDKAVDALSSTVAEAARWTCHNCKSSNPAMQTGCWKCGLWKDRALAGKGE